MDRKRLVHQIDTPYTAVEWPHIQQDDQDSILELLCTLLSPLGEYRRKYTSQSKGKRSKAKKKEQLQVGEAPAAEAVKPPPPELGKYVDVGLASITRGLQQPGATGNAGRPKTRSGNGTAGGDAADNIPYTVVFVARSGQSSAFHCHFPQMVAVASASSPVRLVGFSKACEDRLSECLGIPRASSIALRAGAPQSQALLDFVRQKVALVEVPWLEEVAAAGYRETKINTIEAPVGRKKQKRASKT
ncbi:hypothetical protein MAPG_03031 [Magnaporthiopsis poae ATCC 64411]|uniref:Uncharacterized protein n=1 Tax=Magnaporthiopsis poae (strain ATCC 64411 / 73-15) TaxID=644358 RepID=A0A0C4DSY5_MAGP6|nr:hypothetical protein MAPG_03031 [Magnaporthiopsis poae ATCC 64411]